MKFKIATTGIWHLAFGRPHVRDLTKCQVLTPSFENRREARWKLLATSDQRLILYVPMSFERLVSFLALVWFLGGGLWLLISPNAFVKFASLGTRASLLPSQLNKARVLGCVGVVIGLIIVLELANGYIR